MDFVVITLGQVPFIRIFRVKFGFTQCTVLKSILLCRVNAMYYLNISVATSVGIFNNFPLLWPFQSNVEFLSEEFSV